MPLARSTTVSTAVRTSLGALAWASTAASAVPAMYLGVLTIAGAVPTPRRSAPATPHRFAVFVAAHNEQAVIGDTLESLASLNYPRDRYDVFVVADNCTDETAAIVRHSGWEVRERHDRVNPGKGPALNWLFEQLVDEGHGFEAVVIVDADTIVDPLFLREMNGALVDGAAVAQGYYSVRAADRSTAAGLRYAALACRHRLRPLGRTRLGGSAGLYGNGMMFERSMLTALPWTGHLVEDAQMQLELVLRGERVAFVPGAVVRAEMPDTLDASVTQHQRWEQGRIEMTRRYLPTLLRRVVSRDARRRVAMIDSAIDLVVPPLSALVAMQLAATAATTTIAVLARRNGRRGVRRAARLNAAALGVTAAHVVVGLVVARAPRHVWASLLTAPRAIVWKVALMVGLARRDDEVAWQRTERNAETSETSERGDA